ncbi:MAG: ATPase, partial [Alphaproteobacteria bacterium]|nr:ATPase [Alphaproteobacteria bacterium]
MTGGPVFFERIRQHASELWDKLERDPELAGPWHLLFNQVQSPRHVLSELLQNADDVGATEASICIEDDALIFTHNGEDFTEDHFASLCRFAYSNKRDLHTIGFRGIGFKSTFSVGDNVELYTPTLSVVFNRKRFTEPIWVKKKHIIDNRTQVRVVIKDEHRQRELEKNLQEWLTSPVSLLFFRHIRHLQIGDNDLFWQSQGPGPITGTEMMALRDKPKEILLVVRSDSEPFPEESLTEIRQERLISTDREMEFPPCKVEIVLGAKGRLYVVLPTGVETPLPFACNAPFIQDPARLKIKDPETSFTNRWLLKRIGSLAASVMLKWLMHIQSVADKAHAYSLLPEVDHDDNTLEDMCAATVEKSFRDTIEGKPFLLTDEGRLKASGQSVVIPETLFDVWPADEASHFFDESARTALSRHVSENDKNKLYHWGAVEEISKDQIIKVLQNKHLPKPKHWQGLLTLWSYLESDYTLYRQAENSKKLCIIPVQSKDYMYAASEVVRIGEKRLLQSEEDWNFLSANLLVLNQNWPRFLAEQRRSAEETNDKNLQTQVNAAYKAFKAIGLEETSDVSKILERAAIDFFSNKGKVSLSSCVQFTQIACKLGVSISDSFQFITRDGHFRGIKEVILFDADGSMEDHVPEDWCAKHFLHSDYTKSFYSCTADEWKQWISSGRSGISTFPPLDLSRQTIWGKQNLNDELNKRGFTGALYFPYARTHFQIEDWDFDAKLWSYWRMIDEDKDEDCLWGCLVEQILMQPETYWSKSLSARVLQVATTGSVRAITGEEILPTWIMKLRNLPCLPDTRGFYHIPAELLRRTPETESLIDVEPFIHGRFDTESTRPLLKLLGVRDTPTGPASILNRLRALSKTNEPPIHEVEKWYRRLDQMSQYCSTNDYDSIKKAFYGEDIILLAAMGWSKASNVFLTANEDDVPGAAVIRTSVSDLSLWRKIGVAERPTADLAIKWLMGLTSGKTLSQDEGKRVRAILPRHAARIWNECGHWLNLSNEWVPTSSLHYALTMQTLIPWSHLHEWLKQQTADFQRLSTEIIESHPFCDLPALAVVIKDKLYSSPQRPSKPEQKIWLKQVGSELRRIELDDVSETERIRALAADLSNTEWQTTANLEIIPYINGTPAGTTRRTEVLWLDQVLYVSNLSQAKLARLVPESLGKFFNRHDISAALNYCYERAAEQIVEYIEENFKLTPYTTDNKAVDESAVGSREYKAEDRSVDRGLSDSNTIDDNEAIATAKESDIGLTIQAPVEEEPFEDVEVNPDDVDIIEQKHQHHPKPPKPKIIERFAQVMDFQKDGEEKFCHKDGRWIEKAIDALFPWEMRTAAGQIIRYYWLKEHCLEQEPLQIESDRWAAIDKYPELYAFVLVNLSNEPIEIPGERLQTMLKNGEIVLYPATYRLAYG